MEATGYSPFELYIGWNPKSLLDILRKHSESNTPSVEALRKTLVSSLSDAKFSYQLTQARQSAYNSRRCKPHNYSPGDQVWFDRRYFTNAAYKAKTSKKLGSKRFGPFRIEDSLERTLFKLLYRPTLAPMSLFTSSIQKKYKAQPSNISCPKPTPAQIRTDNNGDTITEIGEILSHRRGKNGYSILALSANAPSNEAQWRPLKDFSNDHGTFTESLHTYIIENDILHDLH